MEEHAMGSMNKVLLIGRLGKNPENRSTTDGTEVSLFNLATDSKQSNNEKITEWHRVVAYGKTAAVCNQYLQKGRLVCVEGALRTRTYEKTPGEKRWITEVITSKITFLETAHADADADWLRRGHLVQVMV